MPKRSVRSLARVGLSRAPPRALLNVSETALVSGLAAWCTWRLHGAVGVGCASAYFLLSAAALYYRWDGHESCNRLRDTMAAQYRPADDSGILYGCCLVTTTLLATLLNMPPAGDHQALRAHVATLIHLSILMGFVVVLHVRDVRCEFLRRPQSWLALKATLGPLLGLSGLWNVLFALPKLAAPLTVVAFQSILMAVVRFLPKSFTLGEIVILAQGLSIAIVDALWLTTNRTWSGIPAGSGFPASSNTAPLHALCLALVLGMCGVGLATLPILRQSRLLVADMERDSAAAVAALSIARGGREMPEVYIWDDASPPTKNSAAVAGAEYEREQLRASFAFSGWATAVVLFVVEPWVWWTTGHEAFTWTVNFFVDWSHPRRMAVAAYWCTLVAACLLPLIYIRPPPATVERTRKVVEGAEPAPVAVWKLSLNTRRKVFHALAVIMFVPAYLLEPDFMRLSLALAVALLILVEYVRGFRLFPPLGSVINDFLQEFLDDRDRGCEAITAHMYLLVGCAVPMWLSGTNVVAGLSGILVLGIGDSVASVVGKRFGRHTWPGSAKTVEGTVAFFVTLTISGWVLLERVSWSRCAAGQGFAGGGSSSLLVRYSLASLAASLLEAASDQNDNVVLPLYFHALVVAVTSGSRTACG